MSKREHEDGEDSGRPVKKHEAEKGQQKRSVGEIVDKSITPSSQHQSESSSSLEAQTIQGKLESRDPLKKGTKRPLESSDKDEKEKEVNKKSKKPTIHRGQPRNEDPILPQGNLGMNHVEFLFQNLLQDKVVLGRDVGRSFGEVIMINSSALRDKIEAAIFGVDAVQHSEQKVTAEYDRSLGGNRVLLLLDDRGQMPENLQGDLSQGMRSSKYNHWTTLNIRTKEGENGEKEVIVRYANSIGQHDGRDEIPKTVLDVVQGVVAHQNKIKGINDSTIALRVENFASTPQTALNCGYNTAYHALQMLGHSIEDETIDQFIGRVKPSLVERFGEARMLPIEKPSPSPSSPSAASLLFAQFQALGKEQQQEFLKLQDQNSIIQQEQEGTATPTRGLEEALYPKTPSPKSSSDYSPNSTPDKFRRDFSSSERVSKYVVTELKQGGIFHKYTGERVGTNVSGADGDHITALVVLKEIVYNFLEGKSYDAMTKELPNLLDVVGIQRTESKDGSSAIEKTIIDILQERELFLKENNLTLDRDTRKIGLTKGLRQRLAIAEALEDQNLKEIASGLKLDEKNQKRFVEFFDIKNILQKPEIDSTRELIKYGEKAINASTVAIINLALLKELNKQHNPPSAFPRDRNPGGSHDRDEFEAVRDIKLFLITKELIDNYGEAEDRDEFISDFKKRAAEIMGFTAETGEERFIKDFNEFMKDFVDAGESLEWIDEMQEEIELRTGQEFTGKGSQKRNTKLSDIKSALTSYAEDSDIEKLKATLNATLGSDSIKTLTNNFNDLVSRLPKNEEKGGARNTSDKNDEWVRNIAEKLGANQQTIIENTGKAFNELFDFGYAAHIDEKGRVNQREIDQDIETLYKVSARHISYMFNAFGGLKELSQETRNGIVDNFFNHLASNTNNKDQGWGQAIITNLAMEVRPLDANIVKSEARELVNLEDGNYKLNLNSDVGMTLGSGMETP